MMSDRVWYLGLELSSQGLQAALADAVQGTVHPLSWQHDGQRQTAYPLTVQIAPGGSVAEQITGFGVDRHHPLTVDAVHVHLRRAIPFYRRRQRQWQPQMQLTPDLEFSLQDIQTACRAILQSVIPTSAQTVAAERLSRDAFREALRQLTGVVVASPQSWGATYLFNLREVILQANLVETADQVIGVDSTLAIALAYQHQTRVAGEIVVRSQDCTTLALYTDQAVTEAATWVERAADPRFIPHQAGSGGYHYGQQALQEDVFYQLLYPQWLPKHDFLDSFAWPFPRVGEPDFPQRDRATQQLVAHEMGSTVLTLAQQVLKLLQQRPTVNAQLGVHPWQVSHATLQQEVITAVTTRLNETLNHILSLQGQTSRQVRQVLWQPDSWRGAAPLLAQWLQRKFPQARLVTVVPRLAEGLALLSQYPDCLDRLRHQYDDYLLLREILQAINTETVTLSQLCQNLRRQGLNPKDCRDRVAQFLAGYQPVGLVPDADDPWLTAQSQQLLEYRALRSAPLLNATELTGQFRCNPRQHRRFQQYLGLICHNAQQSLADPRLVPWLKDQRSPLLRG